MSASAPPPSDGAVPWRWRLEWLAGNRTPPVYGPELADTLERVKGRTMTPPPRIVAMREAIRYLSRAGVPGAFVECGVWRGGSSMAAALTLMQLGDTERDVCLFDTFAGPPPDTAHDTVSPYAQQRSLAHRVAGLIRRARPLPDDIDPDEVRAGVESTGYPRERIKVVEGDVLDTLPAQAPEQIALLRLDTDNYASTRHELVHLYPRLAEGGVLIVDDYGHYPGAQKATDEYLAETGARAFLVPVDYSARFAVKQGAG